MKNKSTIFNILVWAAALGVIGVLSVRSGWWEAGTVEAIGDLTIDWGDEIASGAPIFTVDNILPGEEKSHSVKVTNNGTVARTVGVQGVKTGGVGNLEKRMDIVISDGSSDLYGGASAGGSKELKDLFDDSAINGIGLVTLDPGEPVTLSFKVFFQSETTGNGKQNDSVMSVVFNITLGIVGAEAEVPEECSDIVFSGPPIFGTSGNDVLVGTSGNDLILGFEGRDRIDGGRGDDCIVGGAGRDRIDGGRGNDVILGNGGRDRMDGGRGNDVMFGGSGFDRMRGGRGDDVMRGNGGPDKMWGDRGDDDLFGGGGDDRMKGDRGNDELVGESGFDRANGGRDRDACDAEVVKKCEG